MYGYHVQWKRWSSSCSHAVIRVQESCACPGVPFPLIPTGPLTIVASLFLFDDTSVYSMHVQFAEQIRFSDALPCKYKPVDRQHSSTSWRHIDTKSGTTTSIESSGCCRSFAAASHLQLPSQPKPVRLQSVSGLPSRSHDNSMCSQKCEGAAFVLASSLVCLSVVLQVRRGLSWPECCCFLGTFDRC